MIRVVLLLAVSVGLTYCTEGRSPVSADSTPPTVTVSRVDRKAATAQPDTPGTPPAQKAYVDADSGDLIPHPKNGASAENSALQPHTLGAATETMEEQPSPVPGGGVMIELKGRFQSPVRATVETNGKTIIEHPASGRME